MAGVASDDAGVTRATRRLPALWAALALLLVAAASEASHITNASFEADGYITFAGTPPTGWSFTQTDTDLRGDTLGLPTDGSRGGRFFLATNGSVAACALASVSQSVDLTDRTSIMFDVDLNCAPGSCAWHLSLIHI